MKKDLVFFWEETPEKMTLHSEELPPNPTKLDIIKIEKGEKFSKWMNAPYVDVLIGRGLK